jgi:hypothetical protein
MGRIRIHAKSPHLPIIIAALTASAVIALVPLRNELVAHQPSLVATNGMATIELAHPLTPNVDLRGAERNPLYRALKLNSSVVQLIEYVRQDPTGYLATVIPLGLYALGLPGWLDPDSPVRWELLGLVGLYAGWVVLAIRSARARHPATAAPVPRTRAAALAAWLRAPTAPLHAFIALHFVTMMIFLPNSYGYRQVLPMYLFVALFAGDVLAQLVRRAWPLAKRRSELERRHDGQRRAVEQYVPRAGAPAGHEELA